MSGALYLGLMSGTSMDGVDCGLLHIDSAQITPLDFLSRPIPSALRKRLLALCSAEDISLRELGTVDVELGQLFADVALELLGQASLKPDDILAIGSHGQTLWHQPRQSDYPDITPFTLQVADPNTICQRTGITTVADFRRKDMAAGGQAAPLVPAFHREFFASPTQDRVVVNVGGMSNITVLKCQPDSPVRGFDTGPGNVLMDAWIAHCKGQRFDEDGQWAGSGECDQQLLTQLINDPYFHLAPPKSTGRELFNLPWVHQQLARFLAAGHDSLRPEDIQATLLELTSLSLSEVIMDTLAEGGEVIICGGGASNSALMHSLERRLGNHVVLSSAELGLAPNAVEAMAFAWMASRTLSRQAIDFTSITGASEPGIAGGIFYYR